jgi:acetolactate synthase-1/2/3 large subunit
MERPTLSQNTSAYVIARFLKARGVDRIFGLCGGHIMPVWMCIDAEGIRVIDVRDERAAVHMAHAHAEMTGALGVALVTAGPGVTNAITGIANAHVARAPVLVLSGRPPTWQENRGALQDLAHTELVRCVTRYARTVCEPALVLQELDEAVARAFGQGSDPGPVYLDFPVNTLRAEVPGPLQLDEHVRAKAPFLILPDPSAAADAAELLWSAKRPAIITGRGARNARPELSRFLERLHPAYLETGESRGLISNDHIANVSAARSIAIAEADVVVTLGRRLDFQLAYGSPGVFGASTLIRIADAPGELRDNRRGTVEIFATPSSALTAILEAAGDRQPKADTAWTAGLRARHLERVTRLRTAMASSPPGSDGRMHPLRLLGALENRLPKDAIVIADGGDFLSYARTALSCSTYLDPGSLGCLGVGVPFGIAAGLARPGQQVVVATGDGSFGFNAIEVDTAVRHGVPIVIVVANNGAWQIETHDQVTSYNRVVGTRLRVSDYAAMARAFGMHGERVEDPAGLEGALDRAFKSQPSLLDVLVTTDAVSGDATSGLAGVPDLQPIKAWDDAERMWRTGGVY